MLISGIFGILAFTGSIVLAVQNKNNRHDHEYYGSYQRRGELGMFGGPRYRHNHEYYGSRQIRGDWPMYGKPSYRPDLEKYGNYWRRDEWETYGEPRYSSELPYYDDFQRRRELEIYGGPSYCSVWNCDTIVAGNVGYSCFSLRYHIFVNQTSVFRGSIGMLIKIKKKKHLFSHDCFY